ncbi:unnamed protein product [Mytilus coruscus]|uniref:Uncharacterized protein n=1 Tax=Mytilus coruscus TaxID=42192 RepID=A0A6J8BZC2_MYTCO|nr:unnamed protein product [Mytilus coruscus]
MLCTALRPDAVHIGKYLLGSLCNRKDRQLTDAVSEVHCDQVLNRLIDQNEQRIVCTVVPEKFRKCDGMLKEPVFICSTNDPSTFVITDRSGLLFSVRLHYPAEVKILVQDLQCPTFVEIMFGVIFLLHANSNNISYYIYYRNKLKIDVQKANKRTLSDLAAIYGIHHPDNLKVKDLRNKLYLKGQTPGPHKKVCNVGRKYICIARIITTVSDKSSTCSALLYTEDSALIYTTASEEDVPIDQILLLLPSTSCVIKDDAITLAEEQYCKVKENLEL